MPRPRRIPADWIPFWFSLTIAAPWLGAASLELRCTIDGRPLPLVAVRDDQLWLADDKRYVAAPPDAQWELIGDLMANCEFVCWSPTYSIARATDSKAMRAPYIGSAVVSHTPPGPGAKSQPERGFFVDWPEGIAQPSALVFAWLVAGEPVQVQVRPITPISQDKRLHVEVEFPLTAAQAAGQSVVLLWSERNFLSPQPIFAQRNGARALAATLLDRTDIIEETLNQGFKPASTAQEGVTLLHFAAEAGAGRTFGHLLTHAPELLDALDHRNTTPLHWATTKNRGEIVRRLLTAGADLQRQSAQAPSVVHLAVDGGHTELVREFLRRGLSPNIAGEDAGLPLQYAVENGYADLVHLLRASGASLETFDPPSPRYLHTAARTAATEVIQWLLEQQVDPNAAYYGVSPLITAIKEGHEAIVRLLLKQGAKPDLPDPDGTTPLAYAVIAGQETLVDVLLEAGATVDKVDVEGITPLHRAARQNAVSIVERLLQAGAKRDLQDRHGRTPLAAALLTGAKESARALLAQGAELDWQQTEIGMHLAAAIRLDLPSLIAAATEQGWKADSELVPGLTMREFLQRSKAAASRASLPDSIAPPPATISPNRIGPVPRTLRQPFPLDPRPSNEEFPAQKVTVEIYIAPDGQALLNRVIDSPDPRLTTAILTDIPDWRYEPGYSADRSSVILRTITVTFPDSENRVHRPWELTGLFPVFKPPGLNITLPRSDPTQPTRRAIYDYLVDPTGRTADVWVQESGGEAFDAEVVAALRKLESHPPKFHGASGSAILRREFVLNPRLD